MSIGTLNLSIRCGDDFSRLIEIGDSDLSGYTVIAQIREKPTHTSALIAEFHIDSSLLAEGKFRIYLTDTETLAITKKKGYYDVRLKDTAEFDDTYIVGEVSFTPVRSLP